MDTAPVDKIRSDMPEVMRCLTEQFAAKNEMNERAKIRRQMKALLDFLSADTTYPVLPKVNANIFGPPQFVRGGPGMLGGLGDYAAQDGPDTGGGIVAVPGAENHTILEEGAA